MLKTLSTRVLQHLLAQNSWANALLQPFSSKSIQFKMGLFTSTLVVLENGNLAIAGETNTPDAMVTIPFVLLPRLIAKDETAKMQIHIEGDTHLASELAKVLSHMQWDYEDDLSKIVGDVPAYKIGEFARQTVNTAKETSTNLAEMLSEYWQEEKPMIAKKRHIEEFHAGVDSLRADVARFEKKLQKLTQKLNSNSAAVDNNQ